MVDPKDVADKLMNRVKAEKTGGSGDYVFFDFLCSSCRSVHSMMLHEASLPFDDKAIVCVECGTRFIVTYAYE